MNNYNDFDDYNSKAARSGIQTRMLTITRTNAALGGGGMSMGVQSRSSGGGGYGGGGGGGGQYGGGAASLAVNATAFGVQTSRDKEKREMQDLNERFASYIEKVTKCLNINKILVDIYGP